MTISGQILRKFSFLPLGKLCQKVSQEKFIDTYIEDLFSVDKKTFTDGIITLLLVASLTIGVVAQQRRDSLITTFLIITTLFLFFIKIVDHLVHSSYELQQTRKDISAIFILNDIWAVWEVTGSIFELIQHITQGTHSELRKKGKQLLTDINLGENPEKTLRTFFKNNQYFDLDHVIAILLHRNTPDEVISLKMEEIKTDFHTRYLSGLQKLSDLASLIIGANSILPISLSLIFLLVGLGNTPSIIFVPTLTILLTVVILRVGFYPFLIDSPHDKSIQENEIGWFLINLGRMLEKIDCQEIALIDLLTEESTTFRTTSETMADIVYNLETTPIIEKTFNNYPNLTHIAQLCDNLLTLDVNTAATSIKKLGTTFNENTTIRKTLQKAVDAEKSRIKVIQTINAVIFGLLIAITPIISMIGKFRDFMGPTPLIPPTYTPWWSLIAMGSVILIGGIYLQRQLSNKKIDALQIILNLALFFITYRIGTGFISQLF